MIEVEIKVRIEDPEKYRALIEEKKGEYKLSLEHEDTYYNLPEELRDFKKTDEALRVRKSTEFLKQNPDKATVNYFLTYKGKKLDGKTKTRKELETKVNKGDEIKQILKHLGMREIFTVKKLRELYEVPFKNDHIELLIDYLPILKDHFIEVELQTKSQEKVEETTAILFEFLKELGISEEDSIRKSYLELIAEKFRNKKRKA